MKNNLIIQIHNIPSHYSQKEYNFTMRINKLSCKLHLYRNHKIKFQIRKNPNQKQKKSKIIQKRISEKWSLQMKRFQMMTQMLSQQKRLCKKMKMETIIQKLVVKKLQRLESNQKETFQMNMWMMSMHLMMSQKTTIRLISNKKKYYHNRRKN